MTGTRKICYASYALIFHLGCDLWRINKLGFCFEEGHIQVGQLRRMVLWALITLQNDSKSKPPSWTYLLYSASKLCFLVFKQLNLDVYYAVDYHLAVPNTTSRPIFHVSQLRLAKGYNSHHCPLSPHLSATMELNLAPTTILGVRPLVVEAIFQLEILMIH